MPRRNFFPAASGELPIFSTPQIIAQRGFLTAELVQAQIDNLAWTMRQPHWQVLNLPHVGSLLKNLLEVGFVVDTTIQVASATCAIITFHDLEQSILSHPVLGGQDLALGELCYHPLVKRNFQLDLPVDGRGRPQGKANDKKGWGKKGQSPREDEKPALIATEFPKISTERLMSLLMGTVPREWYGFPGKGGGKDGNDWTIEQGLKDR